MTKIKYRVKHFQKFCSSKKKNKGTIYCISDYNLTAEDLNCIMDGLRNEHCPEKLDLYLNFVDVEDIGILAKMLREKAYPIDLVLAFRLEDKGIDNDAIKIISDLFQSVGSDVKLRLHIENIRPYGMAYLLTTLAYQKISYPKNIRLRISNDSYEIIPRYFITYLNAAFANPSCPFEIYLSFRKIYFNEQQKEIFRSMILPGPHSLAADIDKQECFSITLISCQFVLSLKQLASQQVVKLLKQGEITVSGKHLEPLEEIIEPVNLTFRGKNDPILPKGISTSRSYQMGFRIFSEKHARKIEDNSGFKRLVKGLKCF